MEPKGDKPRKIVICSPEQYPDMQWAVSKLGYGDILVKPSRFVESGRAYICDPEALEMPTKLHTEFTWDVGGFRNWWGDHIDNSNG